MKVNFIVEDSGPLKYLGCATAAKNLFNELSEVYLVVQADGSLTPY